MRCIPKSLVVLFCLGALQGCQNSSGQAADDQPLAPVDDSAQPASDGDGSLPGEGGDPAEGEHTVEDGLPIVSVGPEGDSSLLVNARRYPLDSALGDIWGVSGDHYNVNFTVANGKYAVESVVIDGHAYNMLTPVLSSAVIHAEMYSPGDQFSWTTYSFSPPDADAAGLAGNAYFDNAWVGVDEDLSGDVEDDERQAVVGGTIDFTGTLPDIELHFSVNLEDGQLVEGHYTGLFDFTRR